MVTNIAVCKVGLAIFVTQNKQEINRRKYRAAEKHNHVQFNPSQGPTLYTHRVYNRLHSYPSKLLQYLHAGLGMCACLHNVQRQHHDVASLRQSLWGQGCKWAESVIKTQDSFQRVSRQCLQLNLYMPAADTSTYTCSPLTLRGQVTQIGRLYSNSCLSRTCNYKFHPL